MNINVIFRGHSEELERACKSLNLDVVQIYGNHIIRDGDTVYVPQAADTVLDFLKTHHFNADEELDSALKDAAKDAAKIEEEREKFKEKENS